MNVITAEYNRQASRPSCSLLRGEVFRAESSIHRAIPMSPRARNAPEAIAQTCSQSEIEKVAFRSGLHLGSRPMVRESGSIQPSAIIAKTG